MTADGRPWHGEGWRCVRCGAVRALGTPRCEPCAETLSRRVAELRSLRTGLPAHLTTFEPSVPDDTYSAAVEPAGPGSDELPPRVSQLVSLLRTGHVLTGRSISSLLGCSERTGRRLLAEAHRVLAAISE